MRAAQGAPHDIPTLAELIEAVREFIETDVIQATDGRLRFHARVAANVLRMVERELEAGPRHLRVHQERLASLGVAGDGELAAAIRSGSLDDRLDEVTAVVRAGVRDKLEVANPGYMDSPA